MNFKKFAGIFQLGGGFISFLLTIIAWLPIRKELYNLPKVTGGLEFTEFIKILFNQIIPNISLLFIIILILSLLFMLQGIINIRED